MAQTHENAAGVTDGFAAVVGPILATLDTGCRFAQAEVASDHQPPD
jgi:hypothetical protein